MFSRWAEFSNQSNLLLLGLRRSGKTTLLRRLFPHYHYISLDDFDYLSFAERDPKGLIRQAGSHVIIDEIQRCPKLTIAVKYAIDNEGAHFLMTGSSTIGLLDAQSDSLAGRIHIAYLPTACFGEQMGPPTHSILTGQASFLQIKEAYRLLQDAMYFGGFPELLTQPTNEAKQELLQNYKNTYFMRDITQMAHLDNMEGMLSLYLQLVRNTGSQIEVSHFAREAGISFATAKKYLNILIQSQFVFKLYGYQHGPAKRLIKAGKLYYSDTGILNSFRVGVNEGQLLESFVISELRKRKQIGFLKAEQFYYYQSIGGQEIDLIIDLPSENKTLAIEIKHTEKPNSKDIRGLKDFLANNPQNHQAILFYMGEHYDEWQHVKLIPIAALYRGR